MDDVITTRLMVGILVAESRMLVVPLTAGVMMVFSRSSDYMVSAWSTTTKGMMPSYWNGERRCHMDDRCHIFQDLIVGSLDGDVRYNDELQVCNMGLNRRCILDFINLLRPSDGCPHAVSGFKSFGKDAEAKVA